MKCYFCENEIKSRYRVMRDNKASNTVAQCRSCERLEKRLREKNQPLVHNRTNKSFGNFSYIKNGDVRKQVSYIDKTPEEKKEMLKEVKKQLEALKTCIKTTTSDEAFEQGIRKYLKNKTLFDELVKEISDSKSGANT